MTSTSDDETETKARTRVSRRRETGMISARSLLLTLLGEFVLPRRGPVWTATLVDALAALNVEEKAARQALARASSEGLLTAEKIGRRTRWTLTTQGRQLLEEGAERIYGFLRERRQWDGCWLVLAVTVPESQRQLRHRLRTRLTWAGMGSPAPGLWVVPDGDRLAEISAIVRDLGVDKNALSWVGPTAGIGQPRAVVEAAWSLNEVAAAYKAFTDTFANRTVTREEQAFVAQVELVQAWRRFPFIDPDLPAELLDERWPGLVARDVFHRNHKRWHVRAQARWDALCAEAETRF